MKRWMFPPLLALAVNAWADHQILISPTLFTGSASPVQVWANIGFTAPGTAHAASVIAGPSGGPPTYQVLWQLDAIYPNQTPVQSYTVDYGCGLMVTTNAPFSRWYAPGIAGFPSGTTPFNPMHCDIANQPPTAFDLLSPADGSTVEEPVVDLDWQDASDPDEDPLTYHLYLADSPDDLTDTDPLYTGAASGYEFTGEPGLTYYWTVAVEDGQDHTTLATSTRSFTISDPGSPPELDLIGDRSMFEDDDLGIYVWASDNDEDVLSFGASSDNENVSVLIEGPVEWNDATLTLTPVTNFYGTANITVTVNDGSNEDSETFLLTVENTNDAPNAFDLLSPVDDAVLTSRTLTLGWEAGTDPDPAGEFYYSVYLASTLDNLTGFENEVASWITETSTEVTVAGMGPWYWTVITWDDNEASTEATVPFSFTSDLLPVLEDIEDVSFDEDGTLVVPLVIDDPEEDLNPLEVTSSDTNLTATLEETPRNTLYQQIVLEPATDWSGSALVTLTATDAAGHETSTSFTATVLPVNDVPAAFSLLLPADGATLVPFPGNLSWEPAVDADTEDTVTYTVYMSDNPQTVLENPVEGGLLDPALTVGGTPGDSFWWTVKADDGNSPSVWADETFSFTYDFVNAPPVFTTIGDRSMNEDTSINFVISANDPEGGEVTFEAVSSDPAVVVSWLPQRDSRWIILTPVANWNGEATITVTASDGEDMSSDESFLLTVNPVNDRPTVSEFNMYTLEDTPASIPWEGFDVDGDSLTVESFMSPITVGEVVGDTYIPPADFNGFDAFLYRVFDGHMFSDWTAVQVNIEPVNDNPMLDLPGIMGTEEDVPLVLDFHDYQSDIDLDSLVITVAEPTDLLVTIEGYTVTIQGPANWSGSETLTFTVDDRALRLTATDDLTVNVAAVNDAPVVPTLELGTLEDTALPHALGGTDVEDSPLTFIVSTQPQHGTWLNGVYTPGRGLLRHGQPGVSRKRRRAGFGNRLAADHGGRGQRRADRPGPEPADHRGDPAAHHLHRYGHRGRSPDLQRDQLALPRQFHRGQLHTGRRFLRCRFDRLHGQRRRARVGAGLGQHHGAEPGRLPAAGHALHGCDMAEPDEDMEYTITAAQIVAHYSDPDGDTITSSDVTVDIPADFNGVLPVVFSVTSGDCTVDGGFDLVVEARNDAPSYTLCDVECGEIDDLETFAAAWPTAGITLNDIDGDSLSVVWFVNGESRVHPDQRQRDRLCHVLPGPGPRTSRIRRTSPCTSRSTTIPPS
jgi:hypothetical protein